MKNRNWLDIVRPLLMPVTLVILGVILIVKPDSAAALVGKIVAWILILGGTGMGLAALSGDIARRLRRLVPAAAALIAGIWLMSDPLIIAKGLGRFLGILLQLRFQRTSLHRCAIRA